MRSRIVLGSLGGTALVAGFALRALMAAGPESGTHSPEVADHPPTPVGDIVGVPQTGGLGRTETVSTIMERERTAPRLPVSFEFDAEEPRLRPFTPGDDPAAPAVSQWPPRDPGMLSAQDILAPQIPGTSFKAVGTVGGESPYIPPDTMGDVGPSQILVHVNGRIKLFAKDGTPGALNASDTTFWDLVRAGQGTTDPEVRYDRLSGRWFVMSVNVAPTNNLVLLAVSSGSVIADGSSFTFYSFPIGTGGSGEDTNFCDYPGFGVDANALYIGCNMFNGAGAFQHASGYVVRKSSVLGGGPIVVTPFVNLTGGVVAGPFAPRGVDNDDPQATEGYFIGVDIALFSRVVLRRVSDPGGIPTLSANLNLTVPTTSSPLLQVASGSTTSLDTSDDRLYTASIHKNKISGASTLWTAQHIAVNTSCVGAGTGTGRRNGARWYEIGSLSTTPALSQSGTLCDTAATNPRGYIYPSIIETGQGHVALGATFAAANAFAGAVASGRLRTDSIGSTQPPAVLQNGLASYNLVAQGRNRWGDYSFTDVDPNDDMTVWTLQEYADSPASNWAVRVVQLRAPLPATPASAAPASLCSGLSSTTVTITGTVVSGSGFFDPGPDTGGPGYASHIAAAVSGGVTVNGINFTDPTHVVLDVNTSAATAGSKNVTITNPDAQSTTGNGIVTVGAPQAPIASNNGPACEGSSLQLLASTIPGAVYSWTGPNGFTSGTQNPVIASVGAAGGGTYSVTATVGGCTSLAGTTTVTVIGEGGACNDANACTQTDTCQSGVCAGSNPVTCTPLDQCHDAGVCNPSTGLCSNPPRVNGSACDDGSACTATDACQAGVCVGGSPVVCSPLDQCHVAGACNPATGVCSDPARADGSPCDDADACTQTDTCQAGACAGADPVTCAPLDQCHVAGICSPSSGLCSNPAKADGSACDDADACSQTDTCQAGACTGSNPITCLSLDQCHDAGLCSPSTGLCSNPAKADGSACDDTNACTLGEICNAGICSGGAPVTPLEVNDTLSLTDDGAQTTLSWNDPPADYSVYRGTRIDGTPWTYNQQCLIPRIGTSSATDPDVPPVGSMFFYLVTRVDACGESIPGRDSGGHPNPNSNPCP